MKFAVVFEQHEEGYIVVSCPALPGRHSQGRTREEAVANIREAIQGYIASMRKHGEPLVGWVQTRLNRAVTHLQQAVGFALLHPSPGD
ncbi:MAG: type II toxin-antitoxin system HicB family antitoxin [Dehalococcoidia bacterium]|nr:type II toxin-antitoxin system HicB family antitoxin [Dehalococcoidia bacterium]